MAVVGYGVTHLKSGAILRDKVGFTFSMRKALCLCNLQKYVRRGGEIKRKKICKKKAIFKSNDGD